MSKQEAPEDTHRSVKTSQVTQRVLDGLKRVGGLLIDQWFLLGIGIVILLAHFFPNAGRNGGPIRAEYTVKYLLVSIIFFISGLSLPFAHLYKRALDWRLHVVTHFTCFFIFPALVFGIVNAVRASDPNFERFDKWALVGLVLMGCLPTTVSSNVVMTGQAGGDQSAATIEVLIGNLIGTFLSPALLKMFLSTSQTWAFGSPTPSGSGGVGEIYRQVSEQLGFTVFIPLFVGEVIQWLWPVFIKKWRLKLKLAKFSSLCLIGIIWSTFCNAFYSGSFEALSGSTVTLIVLVNIILYVFFSCMLFAIARIVPMPPFLRDDHLSHAPAHLLKEGDKTDSTSVGWWEEKKLMDAETTIALLFCGAAKGIVLGGPVSQILYGGLSSFDRGKITIPLVLYQGSQVVVAQGTVAILKAWHRRVSAKSQSLIKTEPVAESSKEQTDDEKKRISGSSKSDQFLDDHSNVAVDKKCLNV